MRAGRQPARLCYAINTQRPSIYELTIFSGQSAVNALACAKSLHDSPLCDMRLGLCLAAMFRSPPSF